MADPGNTAIWEQTLDMIEACTMQLDDFIAKRGAWIGRLVARYRQATLSIKAPEGPSCPLCQGEMGQRKG